ncbi:MAG: HAMP domain-containing histidine kinase [Hylemonella sp.]|nr:HAMP domain-containing histidine kinase [Hylemonella sp.]
MPVRLKIALTIFLTGLLTAVGVIATVLYAFERFERESTYYRAASFLERVVAEHGDMLGMQERFPEEFSGFLRNLVLFEPDSQLYLLATDGRVIAMSGDAHLPEGFKVNMAPVREASGPHPMPYVMGDDPQRMDANAVVAARPLHRKTIVNEPEATGYLYLVCHKAVLSQSSVAALQGSFVKPTLLLILVVVALSTLLAAWVAASITRPLSQMGAAVAHITREGLGDLHTGQAMSGDVYLGLPKTASRDEFGQLNNALHSMLDTLRQQWGTLRRLDHFRREGVSNLSHDLRSPLTATAACLETLDNRWMQDEARTEDRQLLGVALRNTRNAARLVQSLGDLAQLDEPEFKLRAELMDISELLDDVSLRFTERATRQGIAVEAFSDSIWAKVDVELLERAIANLMDNALKFCPSGGAIRLNASKVGDEACITVEDTGAGIAAVDLPHLFDRHYQARQSVAPATGEGGKGLGLAIVKRIVELHGGQVSVSSEVGHGTVIKLTLPVAT